VLKTIPVNELPDIENQLAFKVWFEKQLCKAAKKMPNKTSRA
jgi:hypothetical protein